MPTSTILYFISHIALSLSLTLSFNLVLDFCGEKYCDSAKLFVALFSLNNKFVLFVFLELPKNQNSKISIFSQLSLYILPFSLSFAKLYIFFKIQVKIKKRNFWSFGRRFVLAKRNDRLLWPNSNFIWSTRSKSSFHLDFTRTHAYEIIFIHSVIFSSPISSFLCKYELYAVAAAVTVSFCNYIHTYIHLRIQ